MKRTVRNRNLALACVAVVAGMVGLAYASVPLYQLFCQVTGYGGTTARTAAAPAAVSDRTIAIRFDANTNPALPWRFKPAQREITVRLGEPNLAFYKAENLSAQTVTGTASFNVTPFKVGQYFSKIDCFCFTEQTLKAGQTADMPVQFFVDPEIFEDPDTRDVHTITLSYTFFRAEDQAKSAAVDDKGATPDKRTKG
ncbi:MAG: cytochrome c oxidase assembly protein [Rhodospirillaceae bacterium]